MNGNSFSEFNFLREKILKQFKKIADKPELYSAIQKEIKIADVWDSENKNKINYENYYEDYADQEKEHPDDIQGDVLYDQLLKLHKQEYYLSRLLWSEKQKGWLEDTPNLKILQIRENINILANKILDKMILVFQQWVNRHFELDSWLCEFLPSLSEKGVIEGSSYKIDIRNEVREKLNQELKNDKEFTEYLAGSYLTQNVEKIIDSGISVVEEFLEQYPLYVEEALEEGISVGQYVQENHDWEFAEFLIARQFYDPLKEGFSDIDFDVEELDDEWWQTYICQSEILCEDGEILNEEECGYYFYILKEVAKTSGYAQWKANFPGIEKNEQNVKHALEEMKAVVNSNDWGNKVQTISIALNVAHYFGKMYEHLNLTEREMEQLNNLDSKKWDTDLANWGVESSSSARNIFSRKNNWFGNNWYRQATREELQANFQQAFNSIKQSVEIRMSRNINVAPEQIFQEKVRAYKNLLKKEFNILLDNFSNDPDMDMQKFIEHYDQIQKYPRPTIYPNPFLFQETPELDKELKDFFTSRIIGANAAQINWTFKQTKKDIDENKPLKDQEQLLYKIVNLIMTFIKNIDNLKEKDINGYKDLNELENAINEIGHTFNINTDLEYRENRNIDSDLWDKIREEYGKFDENGELTNADEILDICNEQQSNLMVFKPNETKPISTINIDGDIYNLYHPQSLAGFKTFGKGTNWCFRCDPDNDPDFSTAGHYLKNGDIWVIWKNNKPFRAIDMVSNQYMDTEDNGVDWNEFKTTFKQFYSIVRPISKEKARKTHSEQDLLLEGFLAREDGEEFTSAIEKIDDAPDASNLILKDIITKNDAEFPYLMDIVLGENWSITKSIELLCSDKFDASDISYYKEKLLSQVMELLPDVECYYLGNYFQLINKGILTRAYKEAKILLNKINSCMGDTPASIKNYLSDSRHITDLFQNGFLRSDDTEFLNKLKIGLEELRKSSRSPFAAHIASELIKQNVVPKDNPLFTEMVRLLSQTGMNKWYLKDNIYTTEDVIRADPDFEEKIKDVEKLSSSEIFHLLESGVISQERTPEIFERTISLFIDGAKSYLLRQNIRNFIGYDFVDPIRNKESFEKIVKKMKEYDEFGLVEFMIEDWKNGYMNPGLRNKNTITYIINDLLSNQEQFKSAYYCYKLIDSGLFKPGDEYFEMLLKKATSVESEFSTELKRDYFKYFIDNVSNSFAQVNNWYRIAIQTVPQEQQTQQEDIYYSRLARELDKKLPQKAPASEIKKIIQSPKIGVSQSEIEWSGLLEMLDGKGNEQVDKQFVLNFLDGTKIKIKEDVPRGEKGLQEELEWGEDFQPFEPDEEYVKELRENYFEEEMEAARQELGFEENQEWYENDAMVKAEQQAWEAASEDVESYIDESTYGYRIIYSRYEDFTLIDPDKNVIKPTSGYSFKNLNDVKMAAIDDAMEKFGEAEPYFQWDEYAFRGGDNYQEMLFMWDNPYKGFSFNSSHFENESNILAHARFDEREDDFGENILFIEECQSDLFENGRETGYRSPDDISKARDLKDQAILELKKEIEKIPVENYAGGRFTSQADPEYFARWAYQKIFNNKIIDTSYEGYERLYLILEKNIGEESLHKSIQDIWNFEVVRNKLPKAPLSDVKEWAGLVLRRMIKKAAESGFDGISWTTGEQQSERYSFTKYFDLLRICYQPKVDQENNKQFVDIQGSKDGIQSLFKTNIPEEDIPKYIGAELKLRIENAPAITENLPEIHYDTHSGLWMRYSFMKELKGEGLKVISSGMIYFYDKILPSIVNKIGKKYGLQVGQTIISDVYDIRIQKENKGAETDEYGKLLQGYAVYIEDERQFWAATQEEAQEWSLKANKEIVHYFKFNPELVASVLGEGIPVFAKKKSQKFFKKCSPFYFAQKNNWYKKGS